jgi:CRP-like cAMP-binding protein
MTPTKALSTQELRPVAVGYRNTLLKAFDQDLIQRLDLKPMHFTIEYDLEVPGRCIEKLYFVETGMASMTTTFRDGSQVEVGTFGYESAIGVSGLMGTKRSLHRIYTQIEGYGYASPIDFARREFERNQLFRTATLRNVQAQLVQATQSAGCNASHSVEQRLARWLLICADRAGSPSFNISHQFLSKMLGSTRSTVSICAAMFKHQHLVDYTRLSIHILDRPGLEAHSCECYEVIKHHLEDYAQFDSGIVH